MTTESTDKHAITAYIITCLSRKGIKATELYAATGLPTNIISCMKNARLHHKVPESIWEFFREIYKKNDFDNVMAGHYPYQGKSKKESSQQPEKEEEMELIQEATTADRKSNESDDSLKLNAYSGTYKANQNAYLVESEITVGAAIDALIKSGANISIDVKFNQPC